MKRPQWIPIAALSALLIVGQAAAVERTVLMEMFTNTG